MKHFVFKDAEHNYFVLIELKKKNKLYHENVYTSKLQIIEDLRSAFVRIRTKAPLRSSLF